MDKVNDFNFNIELVNNYKDTGRGCLFFTEDNGSGAKYIIDTIADTFQDWLMGREDYTDYDLEELIEEFNKLKNEV